MPRKKIKKKVVPKKESVHQSPAPSTALPPEEIKPTLPIIEGSQTLEIMAEKTDAILYKLENGCTVWVPKK